MGTKTSVKKNVIFFVKYPEKNKIKTRLAKTLKKNFVIELYKCFVLDELETLEKLGANIFIFFQPDVSREKMQSWIGVSHPLSEQKGNDLGERMYNAFALMFENGHKECVIIGSDIPDLPAHICDQAFDILKETDMVIGPSQDGGYYLLGLHETSFNKLLFQDISWSSEKVFSQTLKKAQLLNYKVRQLPTWEDVDFLENLINLYQRNLTTEFYHSHTMRKLSAISDQLSPITNHQSLINDHHQI